MTAITRPIRRLFGRTEPIAAAEPAPAPAVPAELPGVAVDIPETDPLFAFLQAAPRAGGPVAARARVDRPWTSCAPPAWRSSSRWSRRAS